MSNREANHHDAEIVLRAYELRREAVMRESRSSLMAGFWPKSYDDVAAVMKGEHPLNAPFRQVSTYWEMVYGLCKHGAVNANLFMESNAEGLFLFAKIFPYLDQIRRDFFPTAFENAEWVATQCEVGRSRFATIQKRVAQMAEAKGYVGSPQN